MFIFKVFAAVVLASATTAHVVRQTNAAQENSTSCNGVDVPRSEFIGVKLYILSTNIPKKGHRIVCETLTILSNGELHDDSPDGPVILPWSSYSNGCLKFGPEDPASTLTFKYFSDETDYKTAVFFLKEPAINSTNITIIIVASVNSIPQAKVDALQQEAIAAEPSLSDTTFYSMPQSNCST